MRFLVLAILFILSGCNSASTTPNGNTTEKVNLSGKSILQSKCDRACKNLVKSTYGIKTGLYGPHISGPLITKLNGEVNEGNLISGVSVFNSTWNASFNLPVEPGVQQVEMMANYHLSSQGRETVEFTTAADVTYFVGHVLDVSGGSYRWAPILINLDDMKVAYPEEELVWYDR